jgi:hypothetical protein
MKDNSKKLRKTKNASKDKVKLHARLLSKDYIQNYSFRYTHDDKKYGNICHAGKKT